MFKQWPSKAECNCQGEQALSQEWEHWDCCGTDLVGSHIFPRFRETPEQEPPPLPPVPHRPVHSRALSKPLSAQFSAAVPWSSCSDFMPFVFFFDSKIGYLLVLKPTLNLASVLAPHFFNTCYKCLWMSSSQNGASLLHKASGQFSFLNYMKLVWLCCICSLGQPASSLTWQIDCGKKSLSTVCCSTELRKPQHKKSFFGGSKVKIFQFQTSSWTVSQVTGNNLQTGDQTDKLYRWSH